MGNLLLHRVKDKPTVYDGNEMYIEDTSVPTGSVSSAHKAYRVVVDSIYSGTVLTVAQFWLRDTDNVGTLFTNTSGNAGNLHSTSTSNVWENTGYVPGMLFGIVLDTPQGILDVELISKSTNANAQSPKDFHIDYSDDTTDGTNGTWTLLRTITNEPVWGATETRLFPADMAPRSSLHFTNIAGDAIYSALSFDEVDAAIAAADSTDDHILEVTDIAARDALVLTQSIHVRVADATADPNVGGGVATYFYSTTTGGYHLTSASDLGSELKTEAW